MKIALSWLNEWLDSGLTADVIAERLTLAGHEVDDLQSAGDGLEQVVVGEVVDAVRHPQADRLQVCTVVTGGGESVKVVCGAPNARAGLRSALALPGTRLPNGGKLRRSKIRGVESHGMLCSAFELGLGTDADGIIELPADAAPGQALCHLLQLPDTIFDLNLTPNRGDCFSVLGIARELAALTATPLHAPPLEPVPSADEARYAVELADPTACPRFAARVIRDIDPGAASPLWMTERLRRAGIRTIHPVVDVTNYVMLELGQPLHGYDLDKLQGAIRPRFADSGESVTLLDERTVELHPDTVVISDASGPIGLAGIMGGLTTAVSDSTTNVLLEAAFWPQDIMAGRARSYGLHTDASLRFERGVDPDLPPTAIERATELLLAIAGGRAGPTVDQRHDDRLPVSPVVRLRRSRLRQVLGADIPPHDVTHILRGLQFDVRTEDDDWTVTPPGFRFDIVIEEDLIEEVARVFGYDRIAEVTALTPTPLRPLDEAQIDTGQIAETLVARDYQEAITYSFVDADIDRALTGETTELVLSNPISAELAVMRGSLWSGLLPAAAGNLARQQPRVRLFEIGKSFHGTPAEPRETLRIAGLAIGPVLDEQWGAQTAAVDFFDVKADLEALFAMTGRAAEFSFEPLQHPALQPGQAAQIFRDGAVVGALGKLHPSVARTLELRKDAIVFELDAVRSFAARIPAATLLSKYPTLRRDIAIVVADEVSAAEIQRAAAAAVPQWVREVRVFDVYRGPGIEAGLKSIALGLILQETSRTLTDADADSAMNAAVQELQQRFAAVLRD